MVSYFIGNKIVAVIFFFNIKNKSLSHLEVRMMWASFRESYSSLFLSLLQPKDHPTLFKKVHGLPCLQLLLNDWGKGVINKIVNI